MCKCCQACLESCYWHCFEKWFCYDKNIALYEDPEKKEKDNRAYDNFAFWDSVAVIANRSVVTIQPLPQKQNEAASKTETKINIDEPEDNNKTRNAKEDKTEEPLNAKTEDNNSLDVETVILRRKSPIEEKLEKRSVSFCVDANKKKTLKERRKSAAGLTLKLENDFHEIPIIRQNSMPKFFVDTPQENQASDYSVGHSHVLVSPVLPNTPDFNFDLRSIVQIEKEQASQSKAALPHRSRFSQVRKKIKPILIMKHSTKSLPDNVNYI